MTDTHDIAYVHAAFSGPRPELAAVLTKRYVEATGHSVADTDYYVSRTKLPDPSDIRAVVSPRFRLKGLYTNLWVSDAGWVYLCAPSERGVIRYKDLDAVDALGKEEVFRLPFEPSAVWGLDDAHIYVWGVEERGAEGDNAFHVAYFDGVVWSALPNVPFEIRALHGSSSSCLYAVGHKGIVHWDGASWTEIPSPTPESLTSVYVATSSQVFVGGYGGSLLEGSASGFGVVASLPQGLPVFGVAVFNGEVFVGGGPLGLFRRVGTTNALELHKKSVLATSFEVRQDWLWVVTPQLVVYSPDGQRFLGTGGGFGELTMQVDPRDR